MRRERFFRVPLCATDCNKWFEDCKEDYTCTDNWARNFNWVNGINHCPPEAECHTFQEIFVNASNFCERVFFLLLAYCNVDTYPNFSCIDMGSLMAVHQR